MSQELKAPSIELMEKITEVTKAARDEKVSYVYCFGGESMGFGTEQEIFINFGGIVRMLRKQIGKEKTAAVFARLMSANDNIDLDEARENESKN